MSNLFGNLNSLAAIVLGFGFLIFIHELGHHLAAKWVGIKVTQFAIGFGASIVAWRKGIGFCWGSTESEYLRRLEKDPSQEAELGETEYRLNWMPLGGYVKMLGQDDLNPDDSASDDERSFTAKPIWARATVISAGVVMNLIFGALFFVIAFMAGVEFPPATAGSIVPDSAAAMVYAEGHEEDEAYRGLKTGDHITHIDGSPVTDFTDVMIQVALASREQILNLTVQRSGESSPLLFPIKPRKDPTTGMYSIGIHQPVSLTLADFIGPSALPKWLTDANVQSGMTVTHVAGESIDRYDQFEAAVSAEQGLPIEVTFHDLKSGQTHDVAMAALPVPTFLETDSHVMGMVPAIKVAEVKRKYPAAQVGLKEGDVLLRIGPTTWPTWDQVIELIKESNRRPFDITILRDGTEKKLEPIRPAYDGKIGIGYGVALDDTVIVDILPDCPLAKLNLNPGSQILSINGKSVYNFGDIQRILAQTVAAANSDTSTPDDATDLGTVTIEYQANIANTPPTTATIPITPAWASQIASAQWRQPLGNGAFKQMATSLTANNPVAAAHLGIKKTHQVMLQVYVTLARLFERTVPLSQMRGPLGIAHAGTSFAKRGWAYLMFFLGLISINLVVINFLPIPIVDGGLLVFLMIEKIKGSPVSVRIQTAATVVGLALLGSVLLFTLFHDVKRLILGI